MSAAVSGMFHILLHAEAPANTMDDGLTYIQEEREGEKKERSGRERG